MKPLEYIDYKNAINHLEEEIESVGRIYQLSVMSLEMLKKELENVPKPEVVKEKSKEAEQTKQN